MGCGVTVVVLPNVTRVFRLLPGVALVLPSSFGVNCWRCCFSALFFASSRLISSSTISKSCSTCCSQDFWWFVCCWFCGRVCFAANCFCNSFSFSSPAAASAYCWAVLAFSSSFPVGVGVWEGNPSFNSSHSLAMFAKPPSDQMASKSFTSFVFVSDAQVSNV